MVLSPKKKVETFAVDAAGQSQPIAVDEALRDEAIAYYQSASRAYKTGALKARRP